MFTPADFVKTMLSPAHKPQTGSLDSLNTYLFSYVRSMCFKDLSVLYVCHAPMIVGPVSAKPKARHGSEKFAYRFGLLSIPLTFVIGLQPNVFRAAKSAHVCNYIDDFVGGVSRWLHF